MYSHLSYVILILEYSRYSYGDTHLSQSHSQDQMTSKWMTGQDPFFFPSIVFTDSKGDLEVYSYELIPCTMISFHVLAKCLLSTLIN